MDYISEMLKLYFYENRYTKNEINELLEDNPFGEDFVIWEKRTLNDNKTFSITLKNEHLININVPIQEVVIHKDNSVGRYLENEVMYSECSIKGDLNKIRLFNNRLILLKGYYPNEFSFLQKLCSISKPFVTGICTKDEDYKNFVLNHYKQMLKILNDCRMIETQNRGQNILILTNKSK